MNIKIEVLLSAISVDPYVKVRNSKNESFLLAQGTKSSVVLTFDYRLQDSIELFSIEGLMIGKNQRISVVGILLNGVMLKDWRKFCYFRPKIDRENKPSHFELCFDGTFFLNVAAGKDQFLWFNYYYSDRRWDFIYDNAVLDCNAEHHCYSSVCGCPKSTTHRNLFMNRPYSPIHTKGASYDLGCFGCSITAGSGLLRGDEWPARLSGSSSVINLAVPGLGADGIFMNLTRAFDCFKMKRVIVLLPSLARRLLRFSVDDQHFRIPVVPSVKGLRSSDSFAWFSHDWLNDRYARVRDGLVLEDRWTGYSKRIILRMLKILKQNGKPFWISSWCPNTYSFLESLDLRDCLLPIFPANDRGALDGQHPSSYLHEKWVEQVRSSAAHIDGRGGE